MTHDPIHLPGMETIVSMVRTNTGTVEPQVRSVRTEVAKALALTMHFRALDADYDYGNPAE